MLDRVDRIPLQGLRPSGAGAGAQLRLERGETFRGTVAQIKENGELTVLARGSSFNAYAARVLHPGRSYLFMVDRVGPRIVLHVLDGGKRAGNHPLRLWVAGRSARAALGRTLAALTDQSARQELPKGAASLMENLRLRLPGLIYQGPFDRTGEPLISRLFRSGLFLEHRLARLVVEGKEGSFRRVALSDLKGLLLALRESLREAGNARDASRALAAQVEQACWLVENDQLLNLTSLKDNLGWYWFLPGRGEDGFNGADILVEQPEGQDGGLRLALSLEFTHLGRLEAVVHLMPSSDLGILLMLEDAARAEMASSCLEELKEGLDAKGLRIKTVVCRERRDDDPEWAPFTESVWDRGAVDLT
ncbi:MAG: hypothetical protein ACLFUP_01660, partial [Desulfobacteraceae bacterium]